MPKIVNIELLKAHRHAGREYKQGQTIRLPEAKAEWLVSRGTAKRSTNAENLVTDTPNTKPSASKSKE